MRGKKPKERQRYVLRVNETLVEVTRDVYLAWYQSRRKERYQLEKMQKNGVCGIEKVGETSYNSYLHILSPEEIVIRLSEIQELQEALKYLSEEEMELIKTMRPGLIQLEIGVQSTNPDTIRAIHRTMDFPKLAGIVKRIHSFKNIHQHLDLIAGLPYEDYDSFHRSFNDVYALRPQQLQLGFLKVLKGSHMKEMTEEYGIVHKELEPYEVLGTRWLPYEDILKLKMVESMVEVYYNSGQFQNTIACIEPLFEDAFTLYEKLGQYYEKKGYSEISHSRMRRYEILLEFVREETGGSKDAITWEKVADSMIYDLYLREKLKSHPSFEKDQKPYEKAIWEYRRREEIPKTAQIEVFRDGRVLLFDYENRDPLLNNAAVHEIQL